MLQLIDGAEYSFVVLLPLVIRNACRFAAQREARGHRSVNHLELVVKVSQIGVCIRQVCPSELSHWLFRPDSNKLGCVEQATF